MKLTANSIIGVLIIVILILIFGKLIALENKADMNRSLILLSIKGGGYDEAVDEIAKADTVKTPEQKAIDFIMGEIR